MTSSSQLRANKRNSRMSTGPSTAAGKAASSRNATKHGLRSRQPLLADEDPSEYAELRSRLIDHFRPDGALEEHTVDEVVNVLWRLRRLQRVETALYSLGGSGPVSEALKRSGEVDAAVGVAFVSQAASFTVLSRYETSMVNRLRRSIADLERTRSDRDATGTKLVVIGGEG